MKKSTKLLFSLLLMGSMLAGCGQQGPQGEIGPKGDTGLKGNPGVSVVKIEKTSTQGLVDTYTITYSDNTTSTFTVTNGKDGKAGSDGIQGNPGKDGHTPVISISEDGYWVIDDEKTSTLAQGLNGKDGVSIVSIEKTKTEGLVDTYVITYSNQETFTFTVTNGEDGSDGIQGNPGKDGHTPVITISDDGYWVVDDEKTSTLAQGPKGKDGISVVSIVKTDSKDLVDTYTITFSNDETFDFIVTNGANGEQGIQGEPGEDGDTPTISINDQNHWVINNVDTGVVATGADGKAGSNGKSAYEIYCEAHSDYKKSESEWLDEFFKKDETDYSNYNNFEFTAVTYGGVKGYSASYIGQGGEVVVPETFNLEPVLGFKFGFNDMHEILGDNPGYKITSIYFPSSVQFIALNGNSEYALHCLNDTVFIFSGSISEIIYTNYFFEDICFDGTLEELQQTNLIQKFPTSNVYTKNGEGNYEKTINNADIFIEKYQCIVTELESLRDSYLPDMMTKFDDGSIQLPNQISVDYKGDTLEVPIKLIVNDETSACSAYNNKLTYASSGIDRFKGKEVFLAEILFTLEGYEHVGASSTIIVSKMPNLFKTFERSFELKEYNEVESNFIGDKYSFVNTVNFTTPNKQIKAYYDEGFGAFETAMPVLGRDGDNSACMEINFDEANSCLTCSSFGEYSLGFAYLESEKAYVYYAFKLDTVTNKLREVLFETLQEKYTAHGSAVYVNVNDTIVFPDTIEFSFQGIPYVFDFSIRQMPYHDYLVTDGNTVTFKINDGDKAFASVDYTANIETPFILIGGIIGFRISK